jgi:hypothetical protein
VKQEKKEYTFVQYDGQRFMLRTGPFQPKSILYQTKKKLLSGKIDVPTLSLGEFLTILITCSKLKDGGLTFEAI